jgi:hypothetical protein
VGRILRRTVVGFAAFWLVLGPAAGVAEAHARAAVEGVTVSPRATCLTGGVSVTNGTGSDIRVRVDLDGSPAFSGNPVFTVHADGGLFTGDAPTSGPGVYAVYLVADDASETLAGTATYVRPDLCDDFDISYNDTCETVTATVTNHHGSDATISFVKLSGATYELASLTVPDGQTGSVDVPITAGVYDIGAYLTGVGQYLDKFVVKGVGQCPTPTPTPAAPPAPPNLASTGNGSLVPVTVAGVSLILCGVLVIVVLRRTRFRVVR